MRRHNLTIDKVVQHNKWNSKDCPAELRSSAWDVTWDDFIRMINENLAPAPLSRDECRAIIQAKCAFSDPAAVWATIETHRFADDLYRKLAGAMK